ncbi:MAG: hypothetical protein ACK452_03095 [Bacteroidota bacterium]|jgi:hypothetical protein
MNHVTKKFPKLFLFFCFLAILIFPFSCKKQAGPGGKSSVTGRIWVKDFPTMVEYAGYDEYVYIIYGDDISYGDRIRSTYDGRFEFKYLRKGKYKIYAYSMALASLQDSAVVREFEITKNGEAVDLSNVMIYK